jgi:hypothetical protein
MKNWYSICALNEAAEISIYDEIGAYGVSAKAFLADLGKLPDKAPLTLRLNSPGGSVCFLRGSDLQRPATPRGHGHREYRRHCRLGRILHCHGG